MTDREKIIEILKQTSDIWTKVESYSYIVSVDLGKIADTLIEAGIGDVQSLVDGTCVLYVKDKGFMRLYNEQDINKMMHRAEVAEERLKKLKKTEGDLTVEEEINILENLLEEAKHRSFVFERELVKHKIALATVCEEVLHARYPVEYVTVSVVEDFIQHTLKDAEKEIAEGNGEKKEV